MTASNTPDALRSRHSFGESDMRGFAVLYHQHITQADQGCDFDFFDGTAATPEPEIH